MKNVDSEIDNAGEAEGRRKLRGTEVNQDQVESAQHFLCEFVLHQEPLEPEQTIVVKWSEFVRVLAWYGALRAVGVLNGTGTVEKPGVLFNRDDDGSGH